ncbi:MAG TPA: endonuclease domain-containing protein [Xanthobacteraceae bacterium]|nr:endonuclease domain-containing protein [Xanthobacteraceae bacterium]
MRERGRARALRRRPTEPERKLWWHLRHRMPMEGTHFRRQVPIGPYVADFCCLKARLIIEVDGDQHGYDENLRKDERRSKYLLEQGFSVLRFSNREVMTATDGVLEAIYAQLNRPTPTPNPSPASGRLRPSSTGYGGGESRGV